MTQHAAKKKTDAKDIIFPLVIFVAGTVGAVVARFSLPGFGNADVTFLVIMASAAAVGYRDRILRGLLSIPFLYIATAVAAILYEPASPYIGAPFGDFREVEPTRIVKALSFFVIMVAIVAILEGSSRALFKDMSLPKLGMLDNLGGVLVGLVIGVLVAALFFNSYGYNQRWQGDVDDAMFAPMLLRVLDIGYQTQSIWFKGTPGFYVGALNLAENLGE
ncbi:MAG: CvpA family protein [Anaerolineae bacterium]|jgi:uncharacterized membrane protein required for colicin V production